MQYVEDGQNVSPALLWFHGEITRDEANNIINSYEYKHDGLFIVRYSSASKLYVLSILNKEQLLHYQIQHSNGVFFIDSGTQFSSLTELIEHYRRSDDGLPTRLVGFCRGMLAPISVLKRENTKLHKAASKNQTSTVQKIIESQTIDAKCVLLNCKNLEGYTPLHIAIIKGNLEVVKLLIKSGANIELNDDASNSSLYLSVIYGRVQIVKFLLKKLSLESITRISKNSDTGWSVLHEAASRDHSTVLQLLLEAGLPAYPQNDDKNTPADLANSAGNKGIVALLEKAVANPKFSVDFSSREFMHLNIDRKAAAKLLSGSPDGTFLTRKSQRVKGVHVLSMIHGNKDFHYEINNRNDRFWFIDDGPMWDSLESLVGYYSAFSDGLICKLTKPCAKSNFNAQSTGSVRSLASSHCPSPLLPGPSNSRIPPQPPPPPQPETFEQLMPVQQMSVPRQVMRMPRPLSSLMGIPHSSLQKVRKLGEGEFGVVLEGIYTSSDGSKRPVAIKTLRKDSVMAGTQDFMREAEVMHRLVHANIVELIGICEEPSLMLVQELVRYGALLKYLKDRRDKIAVAHQMTWSAQIAAGMSYLEAQKFVHRDLAARNILVAAPDTVKISDFGLSRAIKAESATYQAHKGGKWPVKWYAPESTLYGTFSSASDVWSYGVTLWEIFTKGEMPYGEMTSQAVLEMLEQREERLAKPARCPDDVYSVMMQCWQYEPFHRPSFHQLHQHFMNNTHAANNTPHPSVGEPHPSMTGRHSQPSSMRGLPAIPPPTGPPPPTGAPPPISGAAPHPNLQHAMRGRVVPPPPTHRRM
ncbi:hypothetical protein ACHWQZ_G018962 [Mnemiopsis leidyi]